MKLVIHTHRQIKAPVISRDNFLNCIHMMNVKKIYPISVSEHLYYEVCQIANNTPGRMFTKTDRHTFLTFPTLS